MVYNSPYCNYTYTYCGDKMLLEDDSSIHSKSEVCFYLIHNNIILKVNIDYQIRLNYLSL